MPEDMQKELEQNAELFIQRFEQTAPEGTGAILVLVHRSGANTVGTNLDAQAAVRVLKELVKANRSNIVRAGHLL